MRVFMKTSFFRIEFLIRRKNCDAHLDVCTKTSIFKNLLLENAPTISQPNNVYNLIRLNDVKSPRNEFQ